MFDRAEIVVRGGDGGDGAISFRREKYVPYGGPDGGDGGSGGSVILVADPAVTSLKIFHRKQFYRAENSTNGSGKKRHGRNGADLILRVPVGTVVSRKTTIGDSALLGDLQQADQQVVVARGGKGGWGNIHFTSPTNQAPRIAQKGALGEENELLLELRLIADVGIIGYPNAGKSTLLSAVSAARPKIASYPFTTLEPVLGVVKVGDLSFITAEIPGLIEGAHRGRGLGHDFLRHAMRTKMFVHLIDGGSQSPVDDMIRVNNELAMFDFSLAEKPQVVVINKIDLPEVRERTKEIEAAFVEAGVDVIFISAEKKEGVDKLLNEVARKLKEIKTIQEALPKAPQVVFRPQPRARGGRVRQEGDVFVVEAPSLERVTMLRGATSAEITLELKKRFKRLGVDKALEKAGIKPGDKVRCGSLEWEWT
jgi:GTP-binding protein